MNKTNKRLLIAASFGITLIVVAGLSLLFSFAFPTPYSTILSAIVGLAGGLVQSVYFGHILED